MAEQEAKKEEQEAGTLLVCGATDFYGIGRTKEVRPEYPNLSVPHRLKALEVGASSEHHRPPLPPPRPAPLACTSRGVQPEAALPSAGC